jgi:hypothetical protein
MSQRNDGVHAWLFGKSVIAAVGGFATSRVFFPNSHGTPMFVAVMATFTPLSVWDGYWEATRS